MNHHKLPEPPGHDSGCMERMDELGGLCTCTLGGAIHFDESGKLIEENNETEN